MGSTRSADRQLIPYATPPFPRRATLKQQARSRVPGIEPGSERPTITASTQTSGCQPQTNKRPRPSAPPEDLVQHHDPQPASQARQVAQFLPTPAHRAHATQHLTLDDPLCCPPTSPTARERLTVPLTFLRVQLACDTQRVGAFPTRFSPACTKPPPLPTAVRFYSSEVEPSTSLSLSNKQRPRTSVSR